RDSQIADGGLNGRRGDGPGDMDWLGLTKLTPSAFADELAAFCGCPRRQRGDLAASPFRGGELPPRFLRGGRLFPFEDASGNLTLAIARPTDGEPLRAVEIALDRPVTIAVATAEEIDAALGTALLEPERPSAPAPGEAAVSEDNLDDLRDLAG